MARSAGVAWGAIAAGVGSVVSLPAAIYLTRFSDAYELLHASVAIPVAVVLGVVALALARRTRQQVGAILGTRGGARGTTLAWVLGASLLSPAGILLSYGILALFGILLSAFSTTIALYLSDHDSYAAFNAMVSMPLFFTSSALMPYDVMPPWLSMLAYWNPVSFAIDAIRSLQGGAIAWTRIGALALLAVLVVGFCIHKFRTITI
ncbi:MAG: ABC transporter permease [Methanolinea sp.]